MIPWPGPGLSPEERAAYEVGEKTAAAEAGNPSYELAGMLYLSRRQDDDHWLLLSVPNALVRGVYDALDVTGAELPPGPEGRLNAHITVARPEEIRQAGGPEAFRADRGRRFRYSLGRIVSLRPAGWPEMERAWVVRVHSPELRRLRESHGLTGRPNQDRYDFHVTVAVRPKRGQESQDG